MKITKYIFLFFSLLLFVTSCKLSGIKGNGDLVNEMRRVEEFDEIDISGNFEVEIDVDSQRKVEIIAESNFMNYIKTKVRKRKLFIYSTKNLKPKEDLVIIITTPTLNSIECSGINDILAKNINSENFNIDLSGAASICISGRASKFNVDLSGAADLNAKDFIVQSVNIDVSGAASADIYSDSACRADISGAGNINLYGNAEVINYDISGVGSFNRK